MYTPSHFAAPQADDALALMRAFPFVALITTTAAEPQITHLPVLVDNGMLYAHMARANTHWRAFAQGRTVAVFNGPHAYISPSWYVNPDREVPTWNYAAVHAHGVPELIEPRDDKLALIDRSVAIFEAGNTPPWTRKVAGERLEKMLDAIVAFRMPVSRIEAKFKMNQNRTPADRVQVIEQLQRTAHPDLVSMARWMQAHEQA